MKKGIKKTLEKIYGMKEPLTLEQLIELGFEDTEETKVISRYRILQKGKYKVLYDKKYNRVENGYEE